MGINYLHAPRCAHQRRSSCVQDISVRRGVDSRQASGALAQLSMNAREDGSYLPLHPAILF